MDAREPLRRDVRLLGTLLGRVLVEQEGEELLAAEEWILLVPNIRTAVVSGGCRRTVAAAA